MAADNLSTRGQLERKLSQGIQAFYRAHLGHQPSKVICQLFEAKLAIIAEDSITNSEQILLDEGNNDLAEKVRSDLDHVLKPQLIKLIEAITEMVVVDVLSDVTMDTGRIGIIAVFQSTPQVQNPNAIPKAKKSIPS